MLLNFLYLFFYTIVTLAIVNNIKYNNNLFIAILYYGTNYFIKDIIITFLF